MSLLKFELKEEHIKLLKHLRWSLNDNKVMSVGDDKEEYGDSPFGGDDVYEDMTLILKGKPEKFNPMDDETLVIISEVEVDSLKQLLNELPTALDIILYTGSFEVGHYKTKWYDRNWIKFTPKK